MKNGNFVFLKKKKEETVTCKDTTQRRREREKARVLVENKTVVNCNFCEV